jgi:hypothetical protein
VSARSGVWRRIRLARTLGMVIVLAAPAAMATQSTQRDYLSEAEADQIRDARTPEAKIKLFLDFATDRLKKFQYALKRTAPEMHRGDLLNGLLNGYSGCIDDAADLVDTAAEEREDIHGALKQFADKGKDFLATLQNIQKEKIQIDLYQDTLEDAIDATKDALDDVASAQKPTEQPPERRKPS